MLNESHEGTLLTGEKISVQASYSLYCMQGLFHGFLSPTEIKKKNKKGPKSSFRNTIRLSNS